ncbi:hypothetical protein PsYK624_000650 [Phanerochaete sordida]|uniref:DUF6534 domain-containing protein n=1 Tax=Phanerochaete sordida TaxID=48140 RepID=A0A9P3FWP2_9APHY|nr:hypothetical protein PsYK624_000650 [Phanerochaete sordida]
MAFLLQTKNHNLFRRTDKVILRLTILTINTGLWTAVLAIIDFSLIAWRPLNTVFVIFEYPLSALYLNTFLANLNARKYVRAGARPEALRALSLGPLGGMNPTHVGLGSTSVCSQGAVVAVLADTALGSSGKSAVDSAFEARDRKA